MTTQAQYQQIPTNRIVFSVTESQIERRKHFSEASLKELASSIVSVGLAQPILVRPSTEEQYEVVSGERRVLAHRLAGIENIAAVVRDIPDEQLIELQLVENLQRTDLHPMAEAEGYEGLRKLGRSAEEIADRVGKSRSYVFGRMKLLALTADARRAFYDGRINASVALLIARLDKEEDQQRATKEITNPSGWHRYHDGGGSLSFRAASEYLRREFMLDLHNAIFDPKNVALVPAAGACTTCPKRAGNNPGLFDDVENGDTCTDPACFNEKKAAHLALCRSKAEKSGLPLIEGKQAKAALPYEYSALRPPFVEADDKILRDTEGRTYGKFLKAAGARMFEDPHKAGAWRKVYDLSDAKAKVALEAAGIKVAKPAATTTSKAQKKASKANAAQTQAEEALEEQYAWKLFDATVQKAPTTLTAATLADVIVRLGDSSSPAVEHIIAACGLSKKLTAINDEYELQALGIKELSRLAFAVLLAEKLEYTGSVQQLESAATALKVDCKKIRAEVEAAIKSPPAMEQTSAPTKDKPTPTPALKTKAKAKAVNKPKTKKKAKATQAKKK